ncbi:MAG: hypothetical protein KO217_02495 [Methanobacteriaceae archaeon]|jgi:hypothetical protein|nr:hypothetical protein [Methanobacteriaceae archaeon]
MEVNVVDYGFLEDSKRYYVKYKISDINVLTRKKIVNKLEEELKVKDKNIYLTMYFESEYYPFKSKESHERFDDYKAREEIEMIAYISSILEED